EDGIRDFHVTGVQTCALPISDCGKLDRRGRELYDVIQHRTLRGDGDAEIAMNQTGKENQVTLPERQVETELGAPLRDEFFVGGRSEEHTSELQSRENLVCRLL